MRLSSCSSLSFRLGRNRERRKLAGFAGESLCADNRDLIFNLWVGKSKTDERVYVLVSLEFVMRQAWRLNK